MKKIFALLLAAVMVLSMAACGAKTPAVSEPASTDAAPAQEATEAPATSEAPVEENFVIGISQPFMGHPIRKAGTVLIDAWNAEHPSVQILVTDGQLDANKQIADIEDLIAKEVDILLVAAHQSPTLVGVLQEAKDAGIPVIAFDRTLTDRTVQISEVVNDDTMAGKYCAELLVQGMGETGKVAIIQGPAGNTTVAQRNAGAMTVLDKYPGIEIVADQVANFQRVEAVEVFENILQANPDLTGVLCHNDEMALGVCKVLADAGRDDIIVTGIDGQKDALESVIAGELYGTVRKIVEFPAALDVALEYLTTGQCEPSVFLEPLKIDASNVNDIYNPDAVF